jgi:hypothetical protein
MLDQFFDHIGKFGAITAFMGSITAFYMLWVPTERIESFHHSITKMVYRAGHGSWLRTMQNGVQIALGWMTKLYGPADPDTRSVRGFLTIRAWKVSAWIASFIIFLLPMLILAGFLVTMSVGYADIRAIWAALAALGAALVLSIPFLLTWRGVRAEDEMAYHSGVEDIATAARAIFAEGSLLACLLVPAAAFATAGGIVLSYTEYTVIGWSSVGIAIAGLVLMLLYGFIRAIRRHGFLAPAAYIAILMVVVGYVLPIFIVTMSIADTHTNYWLALSTMPAAILAIRCLHFRYHTERHAEEPGANYAQYLFMLALLAVPTLIFGEVDRMEFADTVVKATLGIIAIGFAPYVLAIYAAVYANAFPDWLSIAVTREILGRALRASSSAEFVLFLLIDLLCVLFFCMLTLIILVGAFAASALIIETAVWALALSPDFLEPAAIFWGGVNAVPMLLMRWFAGVTATPAPAPILGMIAVGVMFALGMTSLLPTLANAAVVLALLIGRVIAILLGIPLQWVHGLLLIEPTLNAEERSKRLLRSASLVGVASGLAAAAIYLAAWALG